MTKDAKSKVARIAEQWWFVLIPMLGVFAGCYGLFSTSGHQYILALNLFGIIINSILFFIILMKKALDILYLDLTIYDLEKRIALDHEKLNSSFRNNSWANPNDNSQKHN